MRYLKVGVVLVTLVVLALAGFVVTKRPRMRPAPPIQVPVTPDAVARGRYLARHVLGCMSCHTPRDWTIYGGPVIEAELGAGGDCITPKEKAPGTICVTNITPHEATGIGRWTDGEVMRAIREGVDRDGNALFPLMPFHVYRHLADDDTAAVVAYLRSIPPIERFVPSPVVDFPMSFIMQIIPAPLEAPVTAPPRSDPESYGGYLAKVGGCEACHTPVDDRKQPLDGRAFAGGQVFLGPWGESRSANLTFHRTGLNDKDKASFIGMFGAYSSTSSEGLRVDPIDNTVMHWQEAAGMTDDDLGAIYDFLKTVEPQDSVVQRK